MPELRARTGGPADEDLLIELFDQAVEWLVARGQVGQWGSEPFSRRQGGRERVRALVSGGGLHVVAQDGQAVGAVVVGDAPIYVADAGVAELYVNLLLTARSHRGQGLGGKLLAIAEMVARERGAEVLRVDCWAGAPTLVAWYEQQGFVRSETFELHGWPGQVFTRAVPHGA